MEVRRLIKVGNIYIWSKIVNIVVFISKISNIFCGSNYFLAVTNIYSSMS